MAHLKKAASGKLLKNAAGHLVSDCGASDPCTDCAADTPNATVTVTGSCTEFDIPPGSCAAQAGSYTFTSFDAGTCTWRLDIGATGLHIHISYGGGVWTVSVRNNAGTALFIDSNASLACSGGAITGSFTAAGQAPNCNGCTANGTVT